MKKFKKVLSLLMMSAMLVLPMAMPVQADEIQNNTNEVETYATKKFGNASIKGDGVRIRETSSTTATILGLLYTGDRVQIINQIYSNGSWWYYIKTESGVKGFILTQYAKYD